MGESAGPSHQHSGPKIDDVEKVDLAFNAFDKNHDGYITKNEMLKTSKNLTKKQVSALFSCFVTRKK